MPTKLKGWKIGVVQFWEKYEIKVVLIIGFCLISTISFELGTLQGQKWQQKPLIIEKNAVNKEEAASAVQSPAKPQILPQEEAKAGSAINMTSQDCAFVGSKNSTKYHLPTCRWAKQIKPENIVCFASADAATAKGYSPDKNCIK